MLPVQSLDPWSQGLMAGASVLGDVAQKSGMSTASAPYNSVFDSSGWVVNTGSGTATNQQDKAANPFSQMTGLLSNPLVLGAIVLGVYFYVRGK